MKAKYTHLVIMQKYMATLKRGNRLLAKSCAKSSAKLLSSATGNGTNSNCPGENLFETIASMCFEIHTACCENDLCRNVAKMFELFPFTLDLQRNCRRHGNYLQELEVL